MKGTQPRGMGEGGEIRLIRMVLIQIPDRAGHALVIIHAGSLLPGRSATHPFLAAIYDILSATFGKRFAQPFPNPRAPTK